MGGPDTRTKADMVSHDASLGREQARHGRGGRTAAGVEGRGRARGGLARVEVEVMWRCGGGGGGGCCGGGGRGGPDATGEEERRSSDGGGGRCWARCQFSGSKQQQQQECGTVRAMAVMGSGSAACNVLGAGCRRRAWCLLVLLGPGPTSPQTAQLRQRKHKRVGAACADIWALGT